MPQSLSPALRLEVAEFLEPHRRHSVERRQRADQKDHTPEMPANRLAVVPP